MYFFERRKFYKILGLFGLNFLWKAFLGEEAAYGESCQTAAVDIINSENALTCPADRCLHWIDGMYFESSSLPVRANVAFLLKFPQSEQEYIDKVVFGDNEKRTLGVRYFGPSDKITLDYPPYLVFDNIDLSASNRYFLVFQIRKKDETKVYRRTLTAADINRSLLNGKQLPAQMRFDLDRAHNGGKISGPYFFRSSLDRAKLIEHVIRARFIELNSNDEFKLEVDFLHNDVDDKHYMRYFIVTDPVGRLLGAIKRSYNDGKSKSVFISEMTETERTAWGLTADKVARINDCPYVMVFVDDVKEALAKTILWLR